MIVIIKAIETILSMLIMIGLGYFLTYKKWFNDENSKLLVKLVINVSLPLMMIYSMTNKFTRHDLLASSHGLIVPFLSIGLCYIISSFISKLLKIKKSEQGIFVTMFSSSNTIYMGLPIVLSLFGENSVPYVLMYYFGNTTLFWTIGVYAISKNSSNSKNKIFSLDSLKKIFSPPLLGYFIGVVLVLLDIKIPEFMLNAFKTIGNITTPLAMMFIGITLYSVKIKDLRFDRKIIGVLLGRIVICPLLVILFSNIFSLPLLMRNVFILISAMPVMANSVIVAKSYGVDSEYPAVAIGVTTVAALIVIPIYVFVLQYI